MDERWAAQRDAWLGELDELIRRGHQIKQTPAVDTVRAWQHDCAAAINQLSGGSKAHWLARAYSGAFLLQSTGGGVLVEANVAQIVDRIVEVLAEARGSLSRLDSWATGTPAAPAPRRFDFVHNPQLRPILEQAYSASTRAFEQGDHRGAFAASCGILEAVITDALEHGRTTGRQVPPGNITEWSFDARIAAAERAGLMRGGCARLPLSARTHREAPTSAVAERDARLVRQVLHVVMRDLDPGR